MAPTLYFDFCSARDPAATIKVAFDEIPSRSGSPKYAVTANFWHDVTCASKSESRDRSVPLKGVDHKRIATALAISFGKQLGYDDLIPLQQ